MFRLFEFHCPDPTGTFPTLTVLATSLAEAWRRLGEQMKLEGNFADPQSFEPDVTTPAWLDQSE